jgi:uncharacterized glyoxalase superfamily protein PhnB
MIAPMLSYEDPPTAADWLVRVFGFTEVSRMGTHVDLELGDGLVMVDRPSEDYVSPKRHAEVCEHARAMLATPFVVDGVYVVVDDVDAHFERARAEGATILSELEDNPHVGIRQYRAEDLEGHRWFFAQPMSS